MNTFEKEWKGLKEVELFEQSDGFEGVRPRSSLPSNRSKINQRVDRLSKPMPRESPFKESFVRYAELD